MLSGGLGVACYPALNALTMVLDTGRLSYFACGGYDICILLCIDDGQVGSRCL
jgi:hypothetical protein